MAISIITIDGESYDVGASAGNVAFNNSGTGISAGTVQGAIEEISSTGGGGGGYEPPVDGIPYNDLAQTVRNSLDKADTALQSESDPVFAASAAHGITSTDINNWNNKANSAAIPTKTSDLTNDSGFVTDEDIEDFVTAESIEEIVMGSADVSVIEAGGYINIVFATASITFSPDTTMSLYSGQKTGTLTVSGTHLKQDITLAVPSGFTAQVSGGTAAQSITIPQTDGEVSGVSVTITYTGADSGSYTGSITATSGSTTASVGLVYSQYQGATIIAGTIDTIKAAIGSPQIGELNVSGVNLEDDISASVGNGDFTICATQNGTYGTTATISKTSAEASGGATLYVKYTPSSGTSTASDTLTLTTPRNGANLSKTVTLTGAVVSLTVSESSLSFNTTAGTPAAQTFTVRGANLTQDISISASGTGFSVLPATIDKDDAATEQTVTVTYDPSADGDHTGTVTIQSSGLSETITLSGAAVGVPDVDGEGKFTAKVGGKDFYCKVISGTTNVEIHNSGYVTGYGATLPSKKYSGDVVVPSKVTAIYNNVATEFTVVKLAANSFKSCSGLTSLTLPNTLTEIALCAINDCSNNSFTSLVIPNSVTTLGLSPVYQCQKLTSLIIGTGVTSLNNYFGAGCLSLSSIDIPDNVTEIKDYCFSGGQGNDGKIYFDTVTIGSGLTKISGNSQFKMKAGSAVTISRATPPTLNGTVFVDTSGSTPCGATLYVPSGKVEDYQGTSAYATQFGTSNIQEIK